MKKLISLLFVTLLAVSFTSCADAKVSNIEIVLSDERSIRVELYPQYAKNTVNHFLSLVDKKYYDGLIFHRVIEGFMIQGGGFYKEGSRLFPKGGVSSIYGEFSENGHSQNTLSHTSGVISMARTNDKNSATSQFFICSNDSAHLDGKYAAFGKVMDEESLDVVISISKELTQTFDGYENVPVDDFIIKTIQRI